MRLRIHHRLFLSYALLVAGVVLVLTFGVEATLRPQLMREAAADLSRELALGRELYESLGATDADAAARRMAALTGHRVTIIAPDGTVIGESDVPPADVSRLDNHASRPEFQDALTEEVATSVRYSTSIEADLLYAATRIERGEVLRFAVSITQIDEAIAMVRRQVVLVGGVALLLAALFSLAFSLAVTRPLRRMHRIALSMAGGDLRGRVRSARPDEFGELGRALDTLAGQLELRLGQLEREREEMSALIDSMSEGVLAVDADGSLRRANPAARRIFGLPSDHEGAPPEQIARRKPFLEIMQLVLGGTPVPATELTLDGKHLLATAEPLPRGGAVLVILDVSELRRLEGVRRDFVANVSHELKTPLTAVRGYSETLLDDSLAAETRQRFIATLHENATRLATIVDDLLDLSQIESGSYALSPEPVRVEDVVGEAWQPFADAAEGKQVALVLDVESGCEEVTADRGALRQIFSNLFSNALRYTSEGGRIAVVVLRVESDRVRIDVRDTGSGIPPQHIDRIFERFYRVDPARSRSEGGTGLGLAIVRHLVERHGGTVEAESVAGKGTTIRITLPI